MVHVVRWCHCAVRQAPLQGIDRRHFSGPRRAKGLDTEQSRFSLPPESGRRCGSPRNCTGQVRLQVPLGACQQPDKSKNNSTTGTTSLSLYPSLFRVQFCPLKSSFSSCFVILFALLSLKMDGSNRSRMCTGRNVGWLNESGGAVKVRALLVRYSIENGRFGGTKKMITDGRRSRRLSSRLWVV